MVPGEGLVYLKVAPKAGLGSGDHRATGAWLARQDLGLADSHGLVAPAVLHPSVSVDLDEQVRTEPADVPAPAWVRRGPGAEASGGEQKDRHGVDEPTRRHGPLDRQAVVVRRVSEVLGCRYLAFAGGHEGDGAAQPGRQRCISRRPDPPGCESCLAGSVRVRPMERATRLLGAAEVPDVR